MGSRGPLRDRSSRRGESEQRRLRREGEPEAIIRLPERPDWLPLGATTIWDTIIADLEAARVPLEHIDGSAIAFFVLCIHQAAEAAKNNHLVLSARLNKDAIAWATVIGATPMSRARLGIRPEVHRGPNEFDACDLP